MNVIKRYPNRRLYDTELSRYITMEELADMVASGTEVRVLDAKTNEDLTRRTLVAALLTDAHVQKLDCLPPDFLRTLLSLKDPAMMGLFSQYVGSTLQSFAVAQQAMQQQFAMLQKLVPKPADLAAFLGPWAAAQRGEGRGGGGGTGGSSAGGSGNGGGNGKGR